VANVNDAEITAIYVSQTDSPGVQDDAPNAQNPGGGFQVTLEMVAGWSLGAEGYTLRISCADLTAMTVAPATMLPAFPPATPTFGETPQWVAIPNLYYTYTATEPASGGTAGHVYQYTVSLVSGSGQVVVIKQSDLFILV
jgi:hypothetical protein